MYKSFNCQRNVTEVYIWHRLGHDFRYAIDPTKITETLGWTPETPFEDGIVKTIEWYLNNQEWVAEVTTGDYQNYYEQMYKKRWGFSHLI